MVYLVRKSDFELSVNLSRFLAMQKIVEDLTTM